MMYTLVAVCLNKFCVQKLRQLHDRPPQVTLGVCTCMEKGVPSTTGSTTHVGEGNIGITDSKWESGMASDMMMEGPGGEDTEKYSDKGEGLDCSDQDERKLQ